MSYAICPKCGTQCWLDNAGKEPNLVRTKNHVHIDTDYGPGEDWVEVWKCPECENIFEERNGYP